jgi:methionine synthase I (cobalamin-dependent)
MDDDAWCAVATATHPDLLRSIHEDYVRASADIVTANTFASARHLLERAGIGERTAELQKLAVRLAREVSARARDEVGRAVAVAGSLSTMRPVGKGTDQRDLSVDVATIPWAANLREAAELQAEAGADLLLLEMISDLEHGGLAVEAALATGLPVWVGLSARRRDGELMSFRDDGPSFATLVRHYAAQPIDALGVMHTSLLDTEDALGILLDHASMPVMAYPESGYFRSPDWQFAEVEARALAAVAQDWVRRGVRVIGGCCGLGPAHIAAVAAAVTGGHTMATGRRER